MASYQTVTLKDDAVCSACGRLIPEGSDAQRNFNVPPGYAQRVLLGVSHINDCTRFAPLLRRPR